MVHIFFPGPWDLWDFHISLLIESNLSCGYVSLFFLFCFVCQKTLQQGENVYNE